MDIEKLLKSLNEYEVDYVVIGATAFPIHGYSRATLDIDLLIKPTEKNAQNTLLALKKFGYDMDDVSVSVSVRKKSLSGNTFLKQISILLLKALQLKKYGKTGYQVKLITYPLFCVIR